MGKAVAVVETVVVGSGVVAVGHVVGDIVVGSVVVVGDVEEVDGVVVLLEV